MAILPCGHEAPPGKRRLCHHLIEAKNQGQKPLFSGSLRGNGLDYDLCCVECAKSIKAGKTVPFLEACAQCVAYFDTGNWRVENWLGLPGVEEALVPFDTTFRWQLLPETVSRAEACLPLKEGRVLCFAEQKLYFLSESCTSLVLEVECLVEAEKDSRKPLQTRLLASTDERFIAIVHDYGRLGAVVDLQTAQITMKLDRDDYHVEQIPFPVAFFRDGERALLVMATDWNRLDIADPLTGQLLTERSPTSYGEGEETPPHYLDYFHGKLLVSPDEKMVLDDGWVWHPVGIPVSWSLEAWLHSNVWEAEDGSSRRELCYRDYYWDHPMSWVGNNNVAIAGIGDDDLAMLSGIRIFDVYTGEETNAFAGPSGRYFSDGLRLFSVEPDGLQLWSVESGARVGRIPDFFPMFQVGNELIEIKGHELRAWNYSKAFTEA